MPNEAVPDGTVAVAPNRNTAMPDGTIAVASSWNAAVPDGTIAVAMSGLNSIVCDSMGGSVSMHTFCTHTQDIKHPSIQASKHPSAQYDCSILLTRPFVPVGNS